MLIYNQESPFFCQNFKFKHFGYFIYSRLMPQSLRSVFIFFRLETYQGPNQAKIHNYQLSLPLTFSNFKNIFFKYRIIF
jgi:hypothetical protein